MSFKTLRNIPTPKLWMVYISGSTVNDYYELCNEKFLVLCCILYYITLHYIILLLIWGKIQKTKKNIRMLWVNDNIISIFGWTINTKQTQFLQTAMIFSASPGRYDGFTFINKNNIIHSWDPCGGQTNTEMSLKKWRWHQKYSSMLVSHHHLIMKQWWNLQIKVTLPVHCGYLTPQACSQP